MKSYKIDGTHEVIFSRDMTIAELLDTDYHLLSILERLGIELPFGDITVGQMCDRYGMSSALFLQICRIYATSDEEISTDELHTEDLTTLIKFLRSSHHYYLDVILPRIEAGIESVLQYCDLRQQLLLRRFYTDYEAEVREHLQYEDDTMFPYLEALVSGKQPEPEMIEHYLDNHTDICEKIDDMKSIIIKYLPERCSIHQRCDLLYDVYAMREDLARHTLLETDLMAPLALMAHKR